MPANIHNMNAVIPPAIAIHIPKLLNIFILSTFILSGFSFLIFWFLLCAPFLPAGHIGYHVQRLLNTGSTYDLACRHVISVMN